MALNDSPFIIPSFVSSKRVPGPPPLNFSLRSKDEALEQEASEAYIDHLRRLADEWIDSGKSRSGEGENPVERRLTPNLRELLDGWASRNKPFIGFKPSGDIVLFMPACKMDFSSPLEAARNEAVRLFATFMDSPHRSSAAPIGRAARSGRCRRDIRRRDRDWARTRPRRTRLPRSAPRPGRAGRTSAAARPRCAARCPSRRCRSVFRPV